MTQSELIGNTTRVAVEHMDESDRQSVKLAAEAHAREVTARVWGRTIDHDALDWRWNDRLRSASARYFPRAHGDGPAIELAWGYYRQHGELELFRCVRHELIHAWQDFHPDGGRIGHGPKFRQWLDDLDTDRHCKHW